MDGVVMDSIYRRARTDPTRTALCADDVKVSYLRFARGIDAMRRAMAAHQLPVGSTAIVAIRSLLDGWTTVLALRSLGLQTVAVMNLDDALALGLADVSCVVTDPQKYEQSRFMGQHWPGVRLVRVSEAIYAALADGPAPPDRSGDVPMGGHMLYTSGTTGRYKLLFKDADHETERCALRAASYGLRESAAWYVGHLGMWTAVGYKMPLAVWNIGGQVVLDQRPSWARTFLERPCDALLIPEMVSSLLELTPSHSLPGDWHLWVTAGFLPAVQAREILARLTRRLGISYGSTELCAPVLQGQVQDVEDMHWLAPPPERDVQIVDEKLQPCAEGVEGQLRVRLCALDAGAYPNDAEASRKVFRMGYFYPGDMAVRRSDGRIRVLGRSADVLNLQGRKVAVAPVEQAIQDWLGVSAVCIFSGIDDQGLDEVVVALETAKEPPPEQLESLRRELGSFERIRFVLRAEFPRTTTGTSKINRRSLRGQLFVS